MKKCIKCNVEKELIEFSKNRNSTLNTCKICCKEYNKDYLLNNKNYFKDYKLNNKEKIKESNKEYRLKNIKKLSEYGKTYRNINAVAINERIKKRRLTNPLFKLTCNIRTNIGNAIKRQGYTKKSKTYEILGCSFEEFRQHLEKQFTEGMNWSNQGQWHMDHIYPVSLAKDEEELIKLNHYTNFQPLWAIDNLKKGNKI